MAKRLSEWFETARGNDPAVQPCSACHGTGDTGGRTERGETITCPVCNGAGY